MSRVSDLNKSYRKKVKMESLPLTHELRKMERAAAEKRKQRETNLLATAGADSDTD